MDDSDAGEAGCCTEPERASSQGRHPANVRAGVERRSSLCSTPGRPLVRSAVVDFAILGSLTVAVHGVEVPIVGARVRSLLASLVVRPREAITAERLADELWDDDLPAGYVNGLQALVSRLRRALGDGGAAVVTTTNGYMLDTEPSRTPRSTRETGGWPTTTRPRLATALRDALALWRARPWTGCSTRALPDGRRARP